MGIGDIEHLERTSGMFRDASGKDEVDRSSGLENNDIDAFPPLHVMATPCFLVRHSLANYGVLYSVLCTLYGVQLVKVLA